MEILTEETILGYTVNIFRLCQSHLICTKKIIFKLRLHHVTNITEMFKFPSNNIFYWGFDGSDAKQDTVYRIVTNRSMSHLVTCLDWNCPILHSHGPFYLLVLLIDWILSAEFLSKISKLVWRWKFISIGLIWHPA